MTQQQTATQIMGVLNVTPDSFSDGGHYSELDAALAQAENMLAAGAHWIDIGGESTRPGAAPVSAEQEKQRILPVLQAIRHAFPDAAVSVDTSKPLVMKAAITAGAKMINDVRALQMPGALEVVVDAPVQLCLMHMQGKPDTMQQSPCYDDVIREVHDFLINRIATCVRAGINHQRIIVDPGFGFGKTLSHNLQLMQNLSALKSLDCPILIGVSRKSMIGTVLDKPVEQRLYGGLALATLAVSQGAAIIRTHDVAATIDAVRMTEAVLNAE
ncbi:dihydropteroate synthase [Candidatus Venteria ishoeyi]|uniref:Dihydropteroate synthase n=1 Tax=Candidatus Venteria ishoeyi TaxID=1899563 RepID=A0A1H6F7A6_9GAMM|nr:dihydropteroate synthase [Candidatus Venteria ishoeyi]SEH05209.1 Dihydropteroate synthase [Candidatus Venteria ishoeyi]